VIDQAAKGRMSPSAIWGYAVAYLLVLLSFIAIWFRHSALLYIGRDADLSAGSVKPTWTGRTRST
jgi:hypothetical protein